MKQKMKHQTFEIVVVSYIIYVCLKKNNNIDNEIINKYEKKVNTRARVRFFCLFARSQAKNHKSTVLKRKKENNNNDSNNKVL